MMREILFRGKRIDNGEWIEGVPYGEYMICGIETMRCDDEVPESEYLEFDYFEIDPSTVGQYTSLKDKHGKIIFEGDVLKDSLGWVYETRWDNDNGRFLGYHSKPRGDTYICYVGREPKSTIIGNIHDNPELLEVQHE